MGFFASPPPQMNVTECTYSSFSTNFLVSFIVSFYLFMVAFFLLFLVVHYEMYSWFLVSLVVFFSSLLLFFHYIWQIVFVILSLSIVVFFFIFLLVWYFRKLCSFLYLFHCFSSFESICCIGGGLHLCIPISFVFLSSCNHANSCMEFVRHLGGILMDKGNWRELTVSILLSTLNCSPHLLDYINPLNCLVSFLFTQGCHSISSNSLYKY
jgi:hypothetical protein